MDSRDEISGVLANRAAQTKSKTYSRHVAQVCGGNVAAWRTQYTLSTSTSGTALRVKVAIQVTDGTGSATHTVRSRWGAMIGNGLEQ